MNRIRGKRSGLKPQKSYWEFTQLDLAFMWVYMFILIFSPMFEWVGKYACDILLIPKAWLNILIGICLWVFILIALRLTYFLTDQRTNSKLFVIAALLCLLSINIETAQNDGLWQPCHKFKLDSDKPNKFNHFITHINSANGLQFATRYNIQYLTQEPRQRAVSQVEQSDKSSPSISCSQLLSLIGTSDNRSQSMLVLAESGWENLPQHLVTTV